MRSATLSLQNLQPLVDLLRARDLDVAAILAAGDVSEAQIHDSEARVREEQMDAIWERALEATRDPALGLHVVELFEPGTMTSFTNLFTYLAATSATAREAFERSTRYVRLAHEAAHVEMQLEGELAVCRFTVTGDPRMRATKGELLIGMAVKIAPLVVGDLGPPEAWFEHAEPPHRAEYDRILAAPCRFSMPCYAVAGPASRFDLPLPRADSALCALLEESARERLARLPEPDDIPARVRAAIASALPTGNTSLEAVAESHGTSSSTLRRRLKEAGTTHQKLLDEVRCELACKTLRTPGMSVGEAAFLVGFSDSSAFHKAFRRWTGKSPSAYLRGVER